MSRLLNGFMGKGLRLARGFATRPKFCQETAAYVHPEKRRTFPIVYYKGSELPQKLELQNHPKERLRGKESMRQFSKRENNFYSDMHRWAEFRRKITYGIY